MNAQWSTAPLEGRATAGSNSVRWRFASCYISIVTLSIYWGRASGFTFVKDIQVRSKHPCCRNAVVPSLPTATTTLTTTTTSLQYSDENNNYSQDPMVAKTQEEKKNLATTTTTTTTASSLNNLIFPGGGIFFNWQGGVLSYLREEGYDLSQCTFTGSSAGSLTATLAATGVDFNEATDLAITMAERYHVWDRPEGLQGVLLPMIEEWLDTLLPEQIPDIPEGQLSLLVTPVPFLWQKEKITSFPYGRRDLIDCNLASIYLPFFSDGGLWSTFRSKPYIDGNFLSTGKHYKPPKRVKGSRTIVLNWQKDPAFADKGEKDLVATISPDAVWGLAQQGKEYAKFLEQKGRFRKIPKLQNDNDNQ